MTKSTYLFIETICIKDGNPQNLKWHQERVDNTFKQFFPDNHPIILLDAITNTKTLDKSSQKCRITYSYEIQKIEYEATIPKKINSLKIIKSDNFDYQYKYANRKIIEFLHSKRENYDDIIISIDGFLKDSSFANIALFDGDNYYTPNPPLLFGTKRAQLLEKKIIKPIPIKETELGKFKELHLINALADLNDYVIKTDHIFF